MLVLWAVEGKSVKELAVNKEAATIKIVTAEGFDNIE